MRKSILICVKSNACANIMNLIQSILVIRDKREATAIQKLIDENGYADIYVYCSKDKKNYLYFCYNKYGRGVLHVNEKLEQTMPDCLLNGKVVFKFRCYKVEEIKVIEDNNQYENEYDYYYSTPTCGSEGDLLVSFGDKQSLNDLSCLDEEELDDYLQCKPSTAIHISDLEIFDKPKELSEFYKIGAWKVFEEQLSISYIGKTNQEIMQSLGQTLTKAPRNFCYVEVK